MAWLFTLLERFWDALASWVLPPGSLQTRTWDKP